MIEELNQDYIQTARAKGISEFKVVTRHALRNAILPVVTYIGSMIAMVVTGSFVIEKVFGIPGIGSLFATSILGWDYTLIMGIPWRSVRIPWRSVKKIQKKSRSLARKSMFDLNGKTVHSQ